MNAPGISPQILRLSAVLDLEHRAREARVEELRYLIVNDTAVIVPYQQAALWRGGRVAAASGVAQLDPNGPYDAFLKKALAALARRAEGLAPAPQTVTAADAGMRPEAWAEWFAPEALCVPLPDPRGGLAGVLLLGRQDPFHPAEQHLLAALGGTYGLALAASELPRRQRRLHLRRIWPVAAAAVVAVVAFLPVRSSVLAPAEVVAAAPIAIRAPFDGVVAAVTVSPNQEVTAGEPLVALETTERQAKAEVSDKALEIARTEDAETAQQAFSDPQVKGKLALLHAKVEQAELEASYNRAMLARARVASPIAGVAVFDDAAQWVGRPVTLGERIMMVAPPRSSALDIAVPVGEVVTFAPDSEVLFFPNIAPDRPERGRLLSVSYAAGLNPEGVLAYTARARLAGAPDGLRLGLRGTAKIYGPRRPFVLWALRRPLAVVRQWLSL